MDPGFHPKVTILKPLRGSDPETYSNLRSFCQQDYPQYQIVFAVQDAADPSIEIVQRLIRQFPERDIQLVVSNRTIGINPKINNLSNAAIEAKYELWVLADSDIRVGRDYLQQIVQPFRYPGVGVVTCPYRSQAKGWVALLEALGATAEFSDRLVARHRHGVHFALGATIALRKELLIRSGGFEAIADYLAGDFLIGRLAATIGYRVVLSDYVVDQCLTADSCWEAFHRQTRWARGNRVSRPGSYWRRGTTYGTVASLLLLGLSGGSSWAWVILGLVWLMRLAMGWIVGVVCLQDQPTRRFWWLLPFYDLISFGGWGCGLAGHVIKWRGHRFRLLPDGKLQPLVGTHLQSYALPILEEPVFKKI